MPNPSIVLAPEDWFEKAFDFTLPIGAFPAVMERVRGTPIRLEELVRSVPPALLTVRHGNSWTIQEHVGHLSDLEALHSARLEDFRAGHSVLQAADVTNRRTDEAAHNDQALEDLLSRFRAVRRDLVEQLDAMDAETVGRAAQHPRLGKPMRVIDLVQFTADHDDHHLASIRFLAAKLAAAGAQNQQVGP
ncbi:MAG TPA: DinB family protein [Chloroflexia bacterium]|nr:DinB family protein [Chloroflexia bacterium]